VILAQHASAMLPRRHLCPNAAIAVPLACSVMSAKRMNREDFFAKLASLDEDRLRKVLWNLYWRGSATMRERIEDELDPAEQQRRMAAAAQPADPGLVLYEVREFAELARAGAYIAGDRRVSPKERTRWRVTFRQLGTNAQLALRGGRYRRGRGSIGTDHRLGL
jgi:hypothetical protein